MNPANLKICVVGGGVNGLWSTIELLKAGYKDVTVIAKTWSPFTTSNVAVGVWEPFMVGVDQDPVVLKSWGGRTWEHFIKLRNEFGETVTGIGFISGWQLLHDYESDPDWADQVYGFRHLSDKELQEIGQGKYKYGTFFTTILVDPTQYIKFSTKLLHELGAKTETREVDSITLDSQIVSEYDVVINCCGIASSKLCNDKNVHPIRGQLVFVDYPNLKHFMWDPETYIFPRKGSTLIGGTYQKGNWNLDIDETDAKMMLDKAVELLPHLKNAKVIGDRVGLRPGRNKVRLELEADAVRNSYIVHNYGHGGAGITLHKGCVEDVVEIVNKLVKENNPKI